MHAQLAPMTTSEFARLANLAGLHVGEDDLLQLDRRQLLRPFGPKAHYFSAHLFVLALYFESIRVVRHPWATRAPERKLEDVKVRAQSLDILLTAQQTGQIDQAGAESAGQFLIELERFLASIDPFGPLSKIFNIMHPQVFEGLRGDGRLFAELRGAAQALSDALERAADEDSDATPHDEGDDDDLRSTVAMDLSESVLRDARAAMARPVVHERTTVETELKPADIAQIKAEAAAAQAERDQLAAIEAAKAASIQTPAPAVETAKPAMDETVPSPPPQAAPVAQPAPVTQPAPVAQPAPVQNAPAAAARTPMQTMPVQTASAAPRPVAPQTTPKDDFDDDENVSQPTQILPAIMDRPVKAAPVPQEVTPVETPIQAEKPADKKGFDRGSSHTQRTQSLMQRLEELRNQPTRSTVEPNQVDSQIEELNQLREKFLQAQNWTGLAALYEEKIGLFEEPAERQQIRIALATIYEAKLSQPRKAFESYIFAYETGGSAREKALDGIRRTGRTEEVFNSYQVWLEDRLTKELPHEERRELQGDLALLLHQRGDSQRAFLMFASFLAEDPDRHITSESIQQLEELSATVGDDELDNFFEDIIESGPIPRVVELVGLRAGLSYLSQNQAKKAMPLFRKVLEAAPQNEVAFTNLSRLYEGEQNWSDLASILRKRLTHAATDARPKLEAMLERAYEQEMRADAEAVAKWQILLDSTPDDDQVLRRVVFGYKTHGRHVEAYAFLNRLLHAAQGPEQKVRILVNLADIANNHLGSTEEGQHHLEEALEIGGPSPEIMGGFVDLHMANENFPGAVSAVETLLAIGTNLTKDARLEWLRVGVEAADLAQRGEEREKFASEIRLLESTHAG